MGVAYGSVLSGVGEPTVAGGAPDVSGGLESGAVEATGTVNSATVAAGAIPPFRDA